MSSGRPSDCFKLNVFFWKIYGFWPGTTYSNFYKYYSATYLFFFIIIYNVLLLLNLIYTPWKIDIFIREVIFLFTCAAVTAKIYMVLRKRVEILELFEYLNSKTFEGNDDISKSCILKSIEQYKMCYRAYTMCCHIAYIPLVVYPLIQYLITTKHVDLPVCKYYFLSNKSRDNYFIYFFIYQSFGIYGYMMHCITIDSFIPGIILMAITQLKVINYQMSNWKLNSMETTLKKDVQETIFISKLKQSLQRYELVLKYCARVQDIVSVAMFVQFLMASSGICVVLYGFLLPSTMENTVFLVIYLGAITSEIFVPGWIGTQLIYESQQVGSAAYNVDWIPRSQKFKRSLILFAERANISIKLKTFMFPINLGSFLSIMKTAYSFFSLLRNVQDR